MVGKPVVPNQGTTTGDPDKIACPCCSEPNDVTDGDGMVYVGDEEQCIHCEKWFEVTGFFVTTKSLDLIRAEEILDSLPPSKPRPSDGMTALERGVALGFFTEQDIQDALDRRDKEVK
jgi:hypothetical protein